MSSRSSIDAAAAHRRSGLELFAGALAAGLAVDRRDLRELEDVGLAAAAGASSSGIPVALDRRRGQGRGLTKNKLIRILTSRLK